MRDKRKTFIDKSIRDAGGKIVLGQKPNVYQLFGWVALLLSGPLSGKAGHVAAVVSAAAWLIWALLELFAGINYFRRMLGALVLVVCISLIR